MIIVRNYDVGSYYPHLMTLYNLISRNIPDPKAYSDMLDQRMKAKKEGNKAVSNALKLVANTTYGALLNKYNPLYDPLMGRSVCITGQLFLLELANHLRAECKTLFVVQLNTDGIMVGFDDSEYPKVLEIVKEWEQRTGFELEEDKIKGIIQKDVNNYIEIPYEGDPKIKGGYLVRGVSPAGAFNINNTAKVVAKAIYEYFVNDVDPADTINNDDDVLDFQMIAKAGVKYKQAYQEVDGKKIEIQKVNRVYSTNDKKYGKLYKVKAENGSVAKIEMLPEHCIIDNDNHLTVNDIDKTFYIDMATKRINDFIGITPEKTKRSREKMATKTTKTDEKVEQKTFLQKLFELQTLMDGFEWEKDGKNMHQSYKYISEAQYKHNFKAARAKAGLLWECECTSSVLIPSISEKMHLIKATFVGKLIDPESGEFREYRFEGTGADNGDKALYKAYTGGLKFFLANQYLVAEGNDPEFDEEPTETPKKTKKTTKAPKTTEERTEIKENLLNEESPASELQVAQLKKSLKTLRTEDEKREKSDGSVEKFIAGVIKKTDGFKKLTDKQCQDIMLKIGEILTKIKKESENK